MQYHRLQKACVASRFIRSWSDNRELGLIRCIATASASIICSISSHESACFSISMEWRWCQSLGYFRTHVDMLGESNLIASMQLLWFCSCYNHQRKYIITLSACLSSLFGFVHQPSLIQHCCIVSTLVMSGDVSYHTTYYCYVFRSC